ncbi:transcriptional regulator NrdR [Candidatus Uhrbacteria bacterium RIFCSPLOWO2_02_FULL_51_9]|uniref:Transcriptional repressor NrdR n=1 Tax=Candidatus Uhrbacteria bacterium RIFCSPLOWO2_02_FULL_51_9 TaxID=1802410 RepID=A0A1F7VE56_9BACT|nr:MAG: transcriptional regulator NrdR [Candidatus Uhrbacteria bacterium RIFCSPLOWO2_02_FULL_51_9]
MRCPVCRRHDTRVVDSRVAPDGTSIRRRRLCSKCKYRFSTLEEVELLDITVVKNDGRREAYSVEKVKRGIQHALEKRPVTEVSFKMLINQIEHDIQKLKKREVTSKKIGEAIMRHLKKFDKVAYIRFASVYRQFEDVGTFQRELRALEHHRIRRRKSHKT